MAAENLVDVIGFSDASGAKSVRQFVDFLKGKGSSSPSSPFLTVVDEFI
jgi:hypothetical protein